MVLTTNHLMIADYFTNRFQAVKYKNGMSTPLNIKLSVPQGSVLGPLFFILFINDLAFLLEFGIIMFADDTILYDADADLGLLLSKFSKKLEPLLDWCKFNKLDLNWSKTYFMFIISQRVKSM